MKQINFEKGVAILVYRRIYVRHYDRRIQRTRISVVRLKCLLFFVAHFFCHHFVLFPLDAIVILGKRNRTESLANDAHAGRNKTVVGVKIIMWNYMTTMKL